MLNATELALKGSVALVEQALRDRQRRHRRSPNRIASGTPNLQHLLEDHVFERRQEKKHSLQPFRDIETPEAFSPQRPRLPIGTFGKPGSPSSPQPYPRRPGLFAVTPLWGRFGSIGFRRLRGRLKGMVCSVGNGA